MAAMDTIKSVLEETLDIEPEKVTEEATFESLGIDSLDMTEVICAIEAEMDIDFGEPENLETVGDLAEYLETL